MRNYHHADSTLELYQLQPLLWKEQSFLTCSRLTYKAEKLVGETCTHLGHSTVRHIPVYSYSRDYEEYRHFDRYLGCKLAFAVENKGIFHHKKRPASAASFMSVYH